MDFSARNGTAIYATGDGIVKKQMPLYQVMETTLKFCTDMAI